MTGRLLMLPVDQAYISLITADYPFFALALM